MGAIEHKLQCTEHKMHGTKCKIKGLEQKMWTNDRNSEQNKLIKLIFDKYYLLFCKIIQFSINYRYKYWDLLYENNKIIINFVTNT